MRILITLLFTAFAILVSAQPSEVAAKKIRATEKLQLDTAILTSIVRVISAAATHQQSPTAKAVYDYVSSLPIVGTDLTYSGTSSPVTLNSSTGSDVTITAGTGIGLAATGTNTTITNTAPDQVVSITGATGSYPNFGLPDASSTNELQTLSVLGSDLTISSGNTVTLPVGPTYTAGTGIAISGGNVISNTAPDQPVTITGAGGTYPNFSLPDASATNEIQSLSLAGQALGISGGGAGVTLPIVGVSAGTGTSVAVAAGVATVTNTGDLSNTNELNSSFSVIGPNLQITDASGSLTVSVTQIAPDQSITNETNTAFGVASGALFISDPNSTFNVPVTTIAPDQSATNEAQTLTSGTNSVTLSSVSGVGGGTVTVDTNPNDDITGSGTANFVPKFTGAQAIGSSQIFDNGTYVGVKTTIPTHPLTVLSENSNDNGKIQSWEYNGNAALYNLKLKQTVTSGVVRYNFSQVNNGTAFDNVLVFDRGNVGIGLTDPLSKLHVVGAARITGSGGQATSITGRDANNDLTNITIGSGLNLSLGILSASAPTNTWLIGGNTLAGTSTIGSNSNHAVEIETNGTTKVHVATSGRVGVGTTLPRADLDVRGTIGIQMPSGTTAQRPTVLAPTIRHNSTASALEYADQGSGTDTIWYRLTSKVAPTAGFTSAVLGTSANGASVTFASGSNHLCGTIIIQTASVISTGGANTNAVTVNISPNLGPAGRPFVCISPANSAAAGQNTNFYVSTTNNSTFSLGVNLTLATSTAYHFNYILRQ